MTYIANQDFYTQVALGNVPGHSLVHKFGRNAAVPNGTWAFVTTVGQTAHALSAATAVRIKAGGDVADTAAGAGAREVMVQGIDENLAEIAIAITTAGASASAATVETFWRAHRAWVSAVGTYGAGNTDDIVIENATGGTDIITISADEGQTQDSIWTVPEGSTAYLIGMDITVDAGKAADIRLFTRADMDDTTAPMPSKRLRKFFDGVLGHLPYHPRSPSQLVAGPADVWVEARGAGAGTEVSADFELLVVAD